MFVEFHLKKTPQLAPVPAELGFMPAPVYLPPAQINHLCWLWATFLLKKTIQEMNRNLWLAQNIQKNLYPEFNYIWNQPGDPHPCPRFFPTQRCKNIRPDANTGKKYPGTKIYTSFKSDNKWWLLPNILIHNWSTNVGSVFHAKFIINFREISLSLLHSGLLHTGHFLTLLLGRFLFLPPSAHVY